MREEKSKKVKNLNRLYKLIEISPSYDDVETQSSRRNEYFY